MSTNILNNERLDLSRKALKYAQSLVGELKSLNEKISNQLDERNKQTNLLILRENDIEIWRLAVQLGVEYDRLIEQRRIAMISFSKHFNIALTSISALLIEAIENKDRLYYARGRGVLKGAYSILQSLGGIKVSGLRAETLTDLLNLLGDYQKSFGFRELRFDVTSIINSI